MPLWSCSCCEITLLFGQRNLLTRPVKVLAMKRDNINIYIYLYIIELLDIPKPVILSLSVLKPPLVGLEAKKQYFLFAVVMTILSPIRQQLNWLPVSSWRRKIQEPPGCYGVIQGLRCKSHRLFFNSLAYLQTFLLDDLMLAHYNSLRFQTVEG